MIAQGGKALLVLAGKLFTWTGAGYLADRKPEPGRFHLLTPPSIVAALSAGYRARLHASALALTSVNEGERGARRFHQAQLRGRRSVAAFASASTSRSKT